MLLAVKGWETDYSPSSKLIPRRKTGHCLSWRVLRVVSSPASEPQARRARTDLADRNYHRYDNRLVLTVCGCTNTRRSSRLAVFGAGLQYVASFHSKDFVPVDPVIIVHLSHLMRLSMSVMHTHVHYIASMTLFALQLVTAAQ